MKNRIIIAGAAAACFFFTACGFFAKATCDAQGNSIQKSDNKLCVEETRTANGTISSYRDSKFYITTSDGNEWAVDPLYVGVNVRFETNGTTDVKDDTVTSFTVSGSDIGKRSDRVATVCADAIQVVEYKDILDGAYELSGGTGYIAHAEGIVLDEEGNGQLIDVSLPISYKGMGLEPGTSVETYLAIQGNPSQDEVAVLARYDFVDGFLLRSE